MVWDMVIDPGFSTLAAFTRSRGAYAWPLPSSPINPTDYFMTLQPNSEIDTSPGSTTTHDFIINNVGQMDDSYTLSVSGDSWPTTLLTSSPVAVQSGMVATVSVQVNTPNEPFVSDSFTLSAISVTYPTVLAETQGTTNTVVNPDITATPDLTSQSGLPGSLITYTITIENSGDYTDTFILDHSGNTWVTNLSVSSVGPLAAGDSGVLEVYVVVGSSAEADSVTITIESALDSDISASLNLTTVRELYRIFIPIALKPE